MNNICNIESCTGCSACANICSKQAISMIPDKEGFERPIIDVIKCIDCGLCEKTCPVNAEIQTEKPFECYVGYTNDKYDLRLSSSGGLFSVLCKKWVENKTQYRIVGASIINNIVKHIIIDDIKDLYRLRQSKYVQSSIGNVYKNVKELLQKDVAILFSGTPCQIAGLRNYLKKEYSSLTCVDIVCHGVPSPRAFAEYLRYREKKNKSRIESISFTDKIHGWINKYFVVKFKNKKSYKRLSLTFDDPYMACFLRHYILRPSCQLCHYTNLHRMGDITICDCWGVEKLHPKFHYQDGCSMILLTTQKGKELFDISKSSLTYFQDDYNRYLKYNPQLIKPVTFPSNRDMMMMKAVDSQHSYDFFDKEVDVRLPIIQALSQLKGIVNNYFKIRL